MKAAVRYLAIAVCATLATACGGWDDTARNGGFGSERPYVSSRETVGTSGSIDKEITISGCVTRVAPDTYVLTGIDDRIAAQYQGTAGRAQDPDVTPTDVNRGDNERMRHEQNPSAELGRYRLTGRSDQFVAHVDREVEVKGQVLMTDNRSETPDTLRVGSMRSTGRKCSTE